MQREKGKITTMSPTPSDQKEIEVKAKVKSFEEIKAKLEELGCTFTEPVIQDDTIFVNFDSDFAGIKPADANFLRIRKAKGKILFTLKRDGKNELDCIEREVEISDADQFRDSLEFMGYHAVVQVSKTRVKTKYNDMEICLDEVKNLGSFIEVEKIASGDSDIIQNELFTFLESLGVSKEDRVFKGYDTLLYIKQKQG